MAPTRPTRMFQTEKIGLYLDDIRHRKVSAKGGDGEMAMMDLSFRVQPLSPELAGELDDRVRRTLFRLTDGEPVPHVGAIGFKLAVPQQDLAVFTTPETKRPKFHLSRCDISKVIKARADADMPGFVLTFRVSYAHPTRDELQYFHEGLYKQHFCSFIVTDPSLALEPSEPELDEDQKARELEALRLAELDEAAIMADGDTATSAATSGGGMFEEERRAAVEAMGSDLGDPRDTDDTIHVDQEDGGHELTTELDPGVKKRSTVLPLRKRTAAPAAKAKKKPARSFVAKAASAGTRKALAGRGKKR